MYVQFSEVIMKDSLTILYQQNNNQYGFVVVFNACHQFSATICHYFFYIVSK